MPCASALVLGEKPYDVVCGHVSAAISVRENWGCFLSFRNAKLHCSLFLSLGTCFGALLSGWGWAWSSNSATLVMCAHLGHIWGVLLVNNPSFWGNWISLGPFWPILGIKAAQSGSTKNAISLRKMKEPL